MLHCIFGRIAARSKRKGVKCGKLELRCSNILTSQKSFFKWSQRRQRVTWTDRHMPSNNVGHNELFSNRPEFLQFQNGNNVSAGLSWAGGQPCVRAAVGQPDSCHSCHCPLTTAAAAAGIWPPIAAPVHFPGLLLLKLIIFTQKMSWPPLLKIRSAFMKPFDWYFSCPFYVYTFDMFKQNLWLPTSAKV